MSGQAAYCSINCTQGGTDCPGTDQCSSSSIGYLCRKNDSGPTSPDSGTKPSPDSGVPTPGQDTQAPQVSILEPAANAQVASSTTVKVQATDNKGVVRVDISSDGTVLATRSAAPFDFPVVLAGGTHLLTATAYDQAGNRGTASVSVTVKGSGPAPQPPGPDGGAPSLPGTDGGGSSVTGGLFGDPCVLGRDCQSKLCVEDADGKSKYCTARCSATSATCPTGAECTEATDNTWVCAMSNTKLGARANGGGGCSHGGAGALGLPIGLLLLAGLASLFASRRRCR